MKRKDTVSKHASIQLLSDDKGIMLRILNCDLLECEEGVLTPACVMSFDQAMELAATLCHIAEQNLGGG